MVVVDPSSTLVLVVVSMVVLVDDVSTKLTLVVELSSTLLLVGLVRGWWESIRSVEDDYSNSAWCRLSSGAGVVTGIRHPMQTPLLPGGVRQPPP